MQRLALASMEIEDFGAVCARTVIAGVEDRGPASDEDEHEGAEELGAQPACQRSIHSEQTDDVT